MTVIRRAAHAVAAAAGHPLAFALATVACVAWVATYRDWLNVGSAVTLWLGFAVLNTQHVQEAAMQAKLDELVKAIDTANNAVIGIEREDA